MLAFAFVNMRRLKKGVKNVQGQQQGSANDIALVSVLLALGVFHGLSLCLFCWYCLDMPLLHCLPGNAEVQVKKRVQRKHKLNNEMMKLSIRPGRH